MKQRPHTAVAEPRGRQPLVRLRDVSRVYPMGGESVRALAGVSLDIEEGEFVAIMGPSGSGKSTMMNLIGALDVPTSGHLEINGFDIARLSSDEQAHLRNRTIGFVFQQFNLLPRTTALRQVMLPCLYARERVAKPEDVARHRLQQFGLLERAEHHPNQLSGGQQQRVAIARALVNNPKIILADEPTGALDSRTSAEIMEVFGRLNAQGMTIIIVTHEADVAAHARRIVTFRDGRIVGDTIVPHPSRREPVAPKAVVS
jgi:putative ABC transport system ATP-binding protein